MIREIEPKTKRLTVRFDSWEEFIRASESPMKAKRAEQGGAHKRRDAWTGTGSWEESLDFALNGWREGAERINAAYASLLSNVSAMTMVEDPVFADEGCDFDVPMVLDGEDEHWIQWVPRAIDGAGDRRVVRIAFSLAMSGGVSVAERFRYGSCLAALCSAIEMAGHNVELWAYADNVCPWSEGPLASACYEIPVKMAGQPFDLARVAFVAANAAAYRRHVFALWESEPCTMRIGYGKVSHENSIKADLNFTGIHLRDAYRARTSDVATAWVVEQLEGLGITTNARASEAV